MTSQLPLEAGMEVITRDGTILGHVKDVSQPAQCFRVDCRHAPDLYVPHSYVEVRDGQAILRVTKQQVSYLGWELKPDSYGK